MASPTHFKKTLLASSIAAVVGGAAAPAAYAQDSAVMEEVIVRGIAGSLERSIDIKRDSTSIVEAITADDIGKMPDQNIAESLQRVPGVQIDRRDGVGTQVRIRGLDQNITTLNGEKFFSGMENFQMGEARVQFSNSLEGIPSELLGGVEVYKTPTASMVEGAMGGVVNLKTREALDLDDLLFAANVKVNRGADSEETEPSAFVVLGNNWGDFGAILSLTTDKRVVQNDIMQNFSRENTGIACTEGAEWGGFENGCVTDFFEDHPDRPGDPRRVVENPTPLDNPDLDPLGQSYLIPGYIYFTDSRQERERNGAALNLQWRPTDAWEFGFDWFHSEQDIRIRQYSMKHPMFADNAVGIDESRSFNVIGGEGPGQVGVLQSGAFALTGGAGGGNPGVEPNSGGEITEVETDNFALSGAFDDGGEFRYSFNLAAAKTDLKHRAGYSDQRVTPYAFNGYTGGTKNGYDWVVPNRQDGALNEASYRFVNGELPAMTWDSDTVNALSDPSYWTHKSHWALGSNFENDFTAGRFDVDWDINKGDLKTLSFGVRLAEEEASFEDLRWLSDFSRTRGAASPTVFNDDGSVFSRSTFDPSRPPGASMNVGVQEAVYYDLCRNGGIPAGDFPGNDDSSVRGFCDIDGDGISDNVGAGPNGYFVDAAIGLKAFDLTTSSGIPMIEALYNPTIISGGTVDPANPGYAPLHDESGRFGAGSPNYIPWETYLANPGRHALVSNFFPSGGYARNNGILFENANVIAADPEAWIDNIVTPDTPGAWFLAPLNTWTVTETTTAFYGETDFEGDIGSMPYTLNAGIRVVQTDVDIVSAVVANPQAQAEQWSQSTDIWNSQGALLEGTFSFETQSTDYTDTLPSINFVLDTSENTKFRASAASVIARPDLRSLGQGLSLNFTRLGDEGFQFTGGNGGNPDLDPFRADQIDFAYEWYFGDLGLLSVGVFYKDIESFIQGESSLETHNDDFGGATRPVTRPQNGEGGSVQGLEFAAQQSWENGLGVAFNFTYSDSDTETSTTLNRDVGLPGISETAYNLTGFYDKGNVSTRLAYTWRDEYLSPQRAVFSVAGLSDGASEFFNDYGQWDFNITWDVTEQWSLTAEATNITDEKQTSYLGLSDRPMTYTTQEPRIVLGVSYRL